MNWMIDGLYGDLYRTAMGYRALRPDDEWEIERNMAKDPSLFQRAKTAMRKFWATESVTLHQSSTQISAKERAALLLNMH